MERVQYLLACITEQAVEEVFHCAIQHSIDSMPCKEDCGCESGRWGGGANQVLIKKKSTYINYKLWGDKF